MPEPRRSGALTAVALVALSLCVVPVAHAVQASGSIALVASKSTGVARGEQITIDVFVRNWSTDTPPQQLTPALGFLTGPVIVERLAGDDCCGGASSDLLRFVPGPSGGCEERGAHVAACTEEADGSIAIALVPPELLLPSRERVFLARLRFENRVAPGEVLPRVNLRASTGVGALRACASPPTQNCILTSMEGATLVKGGEEDVGLCELRVCGDGTADELEGCDDGDLVDDDGCDSNCTPTACGNGVVTTGEVCDDGNPTDDDGCDSNCTPTGCGNGVVTSGEACDDANDDPGDACDACGIGICPIGMPFAGARLRLAKLDAVADGEDLTFSGRIDCPDDQCKVVDPLRYGLELRIDAPPRGPLLDLTQRTLVVPPAEATGCDPNDGWRTSSEGRALTYRNHSDALRSAGCAPGSARGLRRLQISFLDRLVRDGAGEVVGRTTEAIAVRVAAQKATFAGPPGSLRLGLVFSGDPDEILYAPPYCAVTSFGAGDCRTGAGGEVTCR